MWVTDEEGDVITYREHDAAVAVRDETWPKGRVCWRPDDTAYAIWVDTPGDEPQPQGVWVILTGAYPQSIEIVYAEEIDALRQINHQGYGTVKFLEYGKNIHEMKED